MATITSPAIDDATQVAGFTRDWVHAWNSRDGDAVAALCAEDLVFAEPALGGTAHGRRPIADFVNNMARAFPDYTFTLEGHYAELTRPAALVAWSFTGTLAGTQNVVRFHGDDRLEFRSDGLIAAYRCLYDDRDLQRQIRTARTA